MLLEELGGQGVTKFIVIGMAGAIQPRLQPCDFAVADRALRDAGVSHHYLPAGRYGTPSAYLTAHLTNHLKASRQPVEVGATWTTDAPYRETAEEVRRYRDEGVLAVEMEAAAVFAVAVSDLLTENGWTGHLDAPELGPNLRRLLVAAKAALAAMPLT
jgi:uridine phosphorylase